MQNPAHENFQIRTLLTPGVDVLFWEKVDLTKQRNFNAVRGDAHWDTTNYPNHKLVHIEPLNSKGEYQFYYAADRANEDVYNWRIGQGEELVRFYLVRRTLYYARSAAEAAAAIPLVSGEFTHPVVATADSRFTKYAFADDTVLEAPKELSSLYIIVKRRYIEPVMVDYRWSEQLKRQIKITKTLIPAGTQQPPPASTPGDTYEVQNGNVFHDILIHQEVVGATYPIALDPLPSIYNRRFPARLDSVDLVWVKSWASATGVSDSYSEDYYFKFIITEPRPGPYNAVALRFITDDPEALQATYPIDIVPTPITESIGVVSGWFYASTNGNQTSAVAKEWSVPETIHAAITVTLSDGNSGISAGSNYTKDYTTTLVATPGYVAFTSLTTMIVDYDVKPAPLGLFEVTVIRIDKTNLYA